MLGFGALIVDVLVEYLLGLGMVLVVDFASLNFNYGFCACIGFDLLIWN